MNLESTLTARLHEAFPSAPSARIDRAASDCALAIAMRGDGEETNKRKLRPIPREATDAEKATHRRELRAYFSALGVSL